MMRKITWIFVAFLALFSSEINAQNDSKAVTIIEQILNFSKNDAVKTNFTLVTKTVASKEQRLSGDITMKGDKFLLNIGGMNVLFDGKTQWAYSEDINEVTITEPTKKEIAETNPMAILAAYKANSAIKMIKSSSTTHTIQITPKAVDSDIKKVLVNVNKKNNYPLSIQITNKKGDITTLTFSQFKSDLKISENVFAFNKNKYKNLETNDLR
ncbi:MAG: LolA family protein [Paludibacteraceae bacterium]